MIILFLFMMIMFLLKGSPPWNVLIGIYMIPSGHTCQNMAFRSIMILNATSKEKDHKVPYQKKEKNETPL